MASVTRYPSANNGGWDSNESYGYADDGSYASTAPSINSTESVEYGNFGFDSLIPADSIINSVTIEAQWYVSTTASSATFRLAALVSNVLKGSEHTDTSEPTSNKDTSYGVTATWSRADLLDGTFEVRVMAQRGAGATGYTMYLDYVRVVVDYTAPISGSADITLDAATLSAAGTVGSASEISGAAAITLDELTSSAAGTVDINGAAGINLEAMTASAVGTVEIGGAASLSLDPLSMSAEGVVGFTPISGGAAISLGALTVSGAGAVEIAGAASLPLDSLTVMAEGTTGFTPITGEASISMESAWLNAAGIVEIHGVLSSNLEGLTAGSAGTVEVAGVASIPLDGLSIAATGTVSYGVDGSLNVTLGDVSLVASGWAQTIVPIPLTFISRTDELSISLPDDILTFRDRSDSLTLSLFSDVLEFIALSDVLTFEE